MKKFTCPYCYGTHTVLSCDMKCSYNVSGLTCKNGTKSGDSGSPKDSSGFICNENKPTCLKCTDAAKKIFCNVMKEEIPMGATVGTSLSIAMIGAKAVGKSNYIAVLIDEIRRKMTGTFNCILDITCSDDTKHYYDDYYYKPLRDGYVVDATDKGTAIPPMFFPLKFLDNRNNIKNIASLTFYDTAGENFDSENAILLLNKYVPNAKGIILLLDPLQVPEIRERIKGKIQLPEQNTEATDVLSRIVTNIRNVKNIRGKIDIPLALVFTKIDSLEACGMIPAESCLSRESEHIKMGAFVQSEFDNTNIEMNNLISNWLNGEIMQMLKQFKHTALFGVSSLGAMPNGVKLSTKVNPRRVLDPLLWLLAENKMIKKVKGV